MENETFSSTPWKEKLEYLEHNYNRQKNHQVLKKKIDNLNSKTDEPSEKLAIKEPDATL